MGENLRTCEVMSAGDLYAAFLASHAPKQGSLKDGRPKEDEILTLNQIISLEPQIGRILQKARRVKNAYWPDYSRYKLRLLPLVGYEAKEKKLQNESAYSTVIMALCDALRI